MSDTIHVAPSSNASNMKVLGARWSSVAAGIKSPSGSSQLETSDLPLDLALLELASGSTVSTVFTQNAFCAAPVQLAKSHIASIHQHQQDKPIYCLINAGNANAGTGEAGYHAAQKSCDVIAAELSCDARRILPFSTGVIGEPLPVQKFTSMAKQLVQGLSDEGWSGASMAIMTTDTIPKTHTQKINVAGRDVSISGIAKGAGMIKPNMATMLAYVVTDAKIAQQDLDVLLSAAVKKSFNRITVDGDTSTNDACLLAATKASAVTISPEHDGWELFEAALMQIMQGLATDIIRDAEGATKFITIDVLDGKRSEECLSVAYTVAESPLVKTAFFASDANWGRILAAVGRANVEALDINAVTVSLNDYCICSKGGRVENYNEETAMAIMAGTEITITINLGRGAASERVWTSDLSLDYVHINADYRS